MWPASRLMTSKCLFNRANYLILRQYRSTTIKGYYPEPITQQTLDEFLADIDYFERPTKFINIGPKLDCTKPDKSIDDEFARKRDQNADELESDSSVEDVDQLLNSMGKEINPPPLNVDDAILNRDQLKRLAIHHGIYRDLFQHYQPRRNQISFSPEQAQRLNELVPHYWITDQPFARVDRHLKKTDALKYFEPVIGISARFVHESSDHGANHAHTAYHGNIIPASEALVKPSITLDGGYLQNTVDSHPKLANESSSDNWAHGQVSCANFDGQSAFHTLLMLNLDSFLPGSAYLHWMVANITKSNQDNSLVSEEVCDYLPVHGIRGFGYSRYVFLLLRHDSKIDTGNLKINDFSALSRRFDTNEFIAGFSSANMTPVGLSWFQTVWDNSSNQVFHDYLKMRAPVYEVVQEKVAPIEHIDKGYPGKVPFHIFMDHTTDQKRLNERALLERLKNVDPFNYKDQYEPPRVPPSVFTDDASPSWMHAVKFRKDNKLGYWRGLRPASATIPHNNNADLDHPIKPLYRSSNALPGYPNEYPAKTKMKLLKDLPYSKPANEHTNVYVVDKHEIFLDRVKKMMKDMQKEEAKN